MRTSPVPPPLWMLLFAVAMWACRRYFPGLIVVSPPWNRVGWFVMALSALPPVAAVVEFFRARTTVNPHKPERASALVTSGIYRCTRNPMYLGLSILLLGWAVALGSLVGFLGPALFVLLIQHVQIRPEERALRARFGEDYARYHERVRRWWGRRG